VWFNDGRINANNYNFYWHRIRKELDLPREEVHVLVENYVLSRPTEELASLSKELHC
jgi:hypothetical protein